MRVARRSLGMYPDETCFDPNRPSWLPYWIDDLTETACEANELIYGNTSGNTAQAAQMITVTNPDGTTSVVSAAAPATIANAQAQCVAQGGTWNPVLNACAPSLISQYGVYIAGAGV